VLDNILVLFFAIYQFPIGGVEGIKGFRLINCINMWVEADQFWVWGDAVNLQIRILFFYAPDDICCYQRVPWGT